MKKKYNVDYLADDLSNSAFFRNAEPKKSEPVNQSTGDSVDRSVGRSISQPTSQSTNQSRDQSTMNKGVKIVDRPKAFYITQRLDQRLDEAVRYLQQKHGIRKVDRSTVVNAILDNEAQWSEESLDLLVSRVISLLTSRLTDR